jgi:hypothetical protein
MQRMNGQKLSSCVSRYECQEQYPKSISSSDDKVATGGHIENYLFNNNNNNNDINNNKNSVLHHLYAESTAARPITEIAPCTRY